MTGAVLVRFGELALMLGPARRRLERMAALAASEALREEGVGFELISEPGRLFVATSEPARAAARLRDVFGIASLSEAAEAPSELDGLVAAAVGLALPRLPRGATFAVRARRAGSHPFTSLDVQRALGSALQRRRPSLRVDLDEPQLEVGVEVRRDRSYVFVGREPGAGGLPLGSGGRCVALLDDGADALVAAWLMMRRGCVPLLLHMDRTPHGGWGPDEAREAARPLRRFAPGVPLRFHSVPFGEVVSAIAEGCQRRYLCILCRRAALAAASAAAERSRAELVVSGGALARAPWGTAHNLAVEDRASSRPVVRPLVGMDRADVACWARRAGISPDGPGCCALDARGQDPHADIEAVEDEEAALGIRGLVSEAVERRVL